MSSEPSAFKNFEGSEKNPQLPDDFEEKIESSSFDAVNGDEALQLVGVEAKEHFSDEFNRKLRRKLVCNSGDCGLIVDDVWIIGPRHPDDIRGSLLHSIPVRSTTQIFNVQVLTAYI